MILEDGFDTIRKPWKHQLETMLQTEDKPNYALFHEVGVGKTLSAIMICRRKMFLAKRPMRVLVLAPPIVLKNWKEEWLKASKFTSEDIGYTEGSGKQRATQFTEDKKVMITNYESLLMPDVLGAICSWKPEIIVADELHRLKSSSAKRTRIAIRLSKMAFVRHRIGLTGTPVLNSPMDLFSQFHFLDKGETFGDNFFVFRNRYFYDKNAGMPSTKHFPDFRIRPGAIEEITQKLSSKCSHVKKSNCLDLPPLVRKKILVNLGSEQKRLYNQMAKDLIAYIDGKAAVAQMALTKALRLMQIVSGFVTTEDLDGTTGLHEISDNPRETALSELLADLCQSSKVIVWACWKQNYATIRAICDRLRLPFVELTGETSAKTRQEAIDRFQSDPSIRVCIGNQGAGGIGATLTASNVSVYYSRNFSLEHDIQSEGRNYRGGSEVHESVTRVDLVAEGTIDERILERLLSKESISASILKDLVLG